MGERVSRARLRSIARRTATLVVAAGLTTPMPVLASPQDGEARPITRDADRVYTTVAGEPDGAATVTNPANLGFLKGFNGIVDLAWTKLNARRRGSGVGVLLGVPLPFQIASLGIAYQYLHPFTPLPDLSEEDSPQSTDDPYSKLSFALAVPLKRWLRRAPRAVRNFSLGITYSRLLSGRNFHAYGTNAVDLAFTWWPSRFLALGFVARSINVPRTGP